MMAERRSELTTAAGMSMRTSCSAAATCSSATALEVEVLNVSAVAAPAPVPAPAPAPATSGRLPAHEVRCAAEEPRPCDALCAAEEPRPCDARCGALRSRVVGTSMWKAGLPTAPSVTELNGPATTS